MADRTDNPKTGLTIFADGLCPLCVKEMAHIKSLDNNDLINVVDIHDEDLAIRYPEVDKQQAMEILHARLDSGEWLFGLDVTHRAWSMVGRGALTGPLRWPLISLVADGCYRLFARNRYTISKWLTGQSRLQCEGSCSITTGKKPRG